jgi:iron complex transport system ATP-binding protein
MSCFFEIQNYGCGYGNKFTIQEINIALSKGSFTGIIGPNGSGKTTLFKGITGDLRGKSGFITLHGINLEHMTFKKKACNLAIVAQDMDMADMTVEDYVIMGRFPYHRRYQIFETNRDIAIAEKYMQLTGISPLKNKYLHQLSGGELQLSNVTRALAQEPELLLLDEPTSHLDITHQAQVLNLVQRLNGQLGLTVLMIIHDLNLAAEYCDHLILIDKGRINTQGKPEEVLTYKNIEEVYGTVVVTKTNPLSGKPVIFLVSDKVLHTLGTKN